MELQIESWQLVGPGKNPAGVHFATNDVQIFYVGADERLYAVGAPTPYGEWTDREFGDPILAARDNNITSMTLKSFPRFGIYGVWHSDDRHRLAIYEYDIDVSEYLEEGSISYSSDNPIATLSLVVTNPDEVLASEDEAALSPGARLYLAFRSGDSAPFPIATCYVDRSVYNAGSVEVDVQARNSVGKVLKDASFDEDHTYPVQNLTDLITNMLINAGISDQKTKVQLSEELRGMSYPPDMGYLEGFAELFKTVADWKLVEIADGTVIVGEETYEEMPQRGKYTFYRDRDVFSRNVTRDDAETYSRVCVRSEVTAHGSGTAKGTPVNIRPEPNTNLAPIGSLSQGDPVTVLLEVGNGWLEVDTGTLRGYVYGPLIDWTKQASSIIYSYQSVPYNEEWGLPKNKTKYVNAAAGTTQAEIDAQALELAVKLSYSGVIETFLGPFRPHLQVGDEVEIIDIYGAKLLGAITAIGLQFGQEGFFTEFTVDSGEVVGQGRAGDYIKKITGKEEVGRGVTRLYPTT